jgi:hypothetical protein
MPQLDKLTFASQYIWLTVFFVGLYSIVLRFFAIPAFRALKTKVIVSLIRFNYFGHVAYTRSFTYDNMLKHQFAVYSGAFLIFNNFLIIGKLKTI